METNASQICIYRHIYIYIYMFFSLFICLLMFSIYLYLYAYTKLQHSSHPSLISRTLAHLVDLSPASRTLLLSQTGPHAAGVFTVLPTSDIVAVPDPHFRVLLLR